MAAGSLTTQVVPNAGLAITTSTPEGIAKTGGSKPLAAMA